MLFRSALIGFLYDQTHTRLLPEWAGEYGYDSANAHDHSQKKYPELSGLAKQLPFVGFFFIATAMASSGLPGFANFVSEFMIIIGTFRAYPIQTMLAIFGVVITAVYYLRAIRAAFFGEIHPKWKTLRDPTTWIERLPFVTLLLVLMIVGFYPSILVNLIHSGSASILERMQGGGGTVTASLAAWTAGRLR